MIDSYLSVLESESLFALIQTGFQTLIFVITHIVLADSVEWVKLYAVTHLWVHSIPGELIPSLYLFVLFTGFLEKQWQKIHQITVNKRTNKYKCLSIYFPNCSSLWWCIFYVVIEACRKNWSLHFNNIVCDEWLNGCSLLSQEKKHGVAKNDGAHCNLY